MVRIDKDKCIGCGACCGDCVSRILGMHEGKACAASPQCLLCGHCVAICPVDAVTIEEYDMEEVAAYDREHFALNPDTLLNSIKFRRSIRQFKDKPVEKEKIEKILEAGRYSPTARNAQNVTYIVLDQDLPQIRSQAMNAFKNFIEAAEKAAAEGKGSFRFPFDRSKYNFDEGDFMFNGAKAVILVVSEHDVNAALASANMELMAEALGLGMYYVGFFCLAAASDPGLQAELGLKKGQKVVTCLAMGYPAVEYRRTVPRRKAVVSWR